MTRKQHLLSIREHLKEGKEKHREKLAKMWDNGQQNTWLYGKLEEQYKRMDNKLDEIMMELFPLI